ncbi:MAG: T9SS type A sorting domain-containing protein [Flavobacteriales bacterium]|nr:T9SS type A sorting domain-containing protein [Flavobacteriales bacterium]MBP7409249.1 T9SS type A sorting domain-containing protein [Flavobacteriales bacterium]
MKHAYTALFLVASTLSINPGRLVAQDLLWLHSEPVGWNMNYQMPNHIVRASANGLVGAARGFGPGMNFGQAIFSSISVDWIDPDTGIPFTSCSMSDSVSVESMAIGDDGTIYVAGRFMGGIQFCDGNAVGGTSGFLDTDLFIAAFSTFGLMWARNISTTHPDGQGIPALELDASGTLWYGLEEFSTIRLISVTAFAEDDQEITINGTRSLGGFGFDPWNNLYVAGSTGLNESPLAFGGLSVPVTETYGLFILRVKADGSGHWARIGSAGTFHNPDVAVDPTGKAFLSSSIMSPMTLGSVQFNGPNWVSDVFIAQVDSTGEFLWGHESAPTGGNITGDMAQSRMRSIDCDGAGNVYLTGTVRGQTQWGNGVVSDAITIGAYAQTVVAFNNGGTAQWAVTSLPSSINAQAVSCDDAGAVYFTGHVNGPYSIGATTVNNGGLQAFVDGRLEGVSTGINSTETSGTLSAWPIPATANLMVRSTESLSVPAELLSSIGQLALHQTLAPGVNTIDLSALDAGIYLLRTSNGSTLRVVKE